MPNDIPDSTWNEADASNTAPVPNGAPEGWFPSDVNNVYRMGMGATKRFWDHLNFTQATAGTSTAYTLEYDVDPQQYWPGEIYSMTFHATCGAAPTLNINALGNRSLRKFNGSTWVPLAAGDIVAGQAMSVACGADGTFHIVFKISSNDATLPGNNAFTGTNSFADTVTMIGAAFNEAARVDVASAATCDIGAAHSNYVRITGTTNITALGTASSGARRHVVFAGALGLFYNATSLILPNGILNITTAAGDCALFESEGSGNWRCLDYQRADGTALKMPSGSLVGRAYAQNVNFTTITSNIPADNTVPQIDEGTQILSVTIDPKASGNRVRATVKVPIGLPPATSGLVVVALFRNGGANAIDSTVVRPVDGTGMYPGVLLFEDNPGSSSTQTYTVRVGGDSSNVVINGDFSGQLGGGTSRAAITLEEFAA